MMMFQPVDGCIPDENPQDDEYTSQDRCGTGRELIVLNPVLVSI
jgi:hypothetical protein